MKKNHWITLIVGIAIALGIYAIPAITQQTPSAGTPPIPNLVAVIDVAQVIKSHPEFISRQEGLQKQAKEWEAAFQKQQEAIENKQKSLQASSTLRPGTAEHQRALDDIANEVAEYEKNLKTQGRKFELENARIMYDIYQDIKATIEKYAVSRGIAQVTDYREFEVIPTVPQTVAEDMDQRLVWYNRSLNITQVITKEIYAARGMQPPVQAASTNGARSANNAPAAPAAPR